MDYLDYKNFNKHDVLAEFIKMHNFDINNIIFTFRTDGNYYVNKSGVLVYDMKIEAIPIVNKIKRFFLGSKIKRFFLRNKRKFYFGVKNCRVKGS